MGVAWTLTIFPVGSVTEKEEEASERVSGLRSVDLNPFDLHTSDVQHVGAHIHRASGHSVSLRTLMHCHFEHTFDVL